MPPAIPYSPANSVRAFHQPASQNKTSISPRPLTPLFSTIQQSNAPRAFAPSGLFRLHAKTSFPLKTNTPQTILPPNMAKPYLPRQGLTLAQSFSLYPTTTALIKYAYKRTACVCPVRAFINLPHTIFPPPRTPHKKSRKNNLLRHIYHTRPPVERLLFLSAQNTSPLTQVPLALARPPQMPLELPVRRALLRNNRRCPLRPSTLAQNFASEPREPCLLARSRL